MIRSFFLPFHAVLLLIRHKDLLKYAFVPWIINILVFIGALTGFGMLDHWLMEKIEYIFGTGWWVPMVTWILGILLFLGFGAGLVLSLTFLANLFSGFFSEQLSEKAEFILTGVHRPSPEGNPLKILVRTTREELKGIVFFLVVWLGLLGLNLIPIIGQILFVVCSGLWSTFCLTFEFTAPATERRGKKFREKRNMIFQHVMPAVTFGAGILLLALIPFVNLFFIPFAVVAGTHWVILQEGNATT